MSNLDHHSNKRPHEYPQAEAGPSFKKTPQNDDNIPLDDSTSTLDEAQDLDEDFQDDLGNGLDPDGYSGPSDKIVKPLTKEALASFQAAQDRAGVIYISRIPPGMRPTKVRHLMSAYGEIGRVYLQQEGSFPHFTS